MFWISEAYAMSPGGAGGEPDILTSMAPLILMFAVFYFLLIRPQQKRAKQHKEMIQSLRKGDEVITSGGLCGRVVDTQEETVTLDLGKTEVTIIRSAVSSMATVPMPKEKKGKKDSKKSEKADKEPAKDDSENTDDE